MTTSTRQIMLELDEDDFNAVQEAMTRRQLFRTEHGCILPESKSNTAGILIAEICRGWIGYRSSI